MDKIRALIVDDSSVMRKIVERSLRQAGIDLVQVMEAGNGAEALGIVKESAVDLILCDINMPVMDGLEFVKHLQAMDVPKRTPVVMITTEGSEYQTWLPLLQLAAEEVFEILLGAKLGRLREEVSVPASEITSMVGLA